MDEQVPLYHRTEMSLQHRGDYANPYTELEAVAQLRGPDGRERTMPLFWDGERRWKLRLAPDQIGRWHWRVQSADAGLDGCAGEFDAVDSDLSGGLTAMPAFPHHFQRQSGDPLWFVGDTAWALFTDSDEKRHNRQSVEDYIDVRAAQGFNAVHAMLISEAGWGNGGGEAFDDLAAERINPAYWREVDERLAYLNQKGITGGLVLAWGDKGKNPNDWREFPSQQARLRYAAYDIYFVVAGEWNADLRHNPGLSEEQARREYGEIGAVLRHNNAHNRLIAIHPMSTGTVREFAGEAWCDFADYQQMYPRLHEEVLVSRRAADKPVVNSEYAYYLRDQSGDGQCDKQNSFGIDTIRHATWDIAMAGGYFITGWGNTYFGGHRNPGPFDVHAGRDDIWEEQVQHIKAFFAQFEWWRLQPADQLIAAPVARSPERKRGKLWQTPITAYWALADAERALCLVYGARRRRWNTAGGKRYLCPAPR